VEFVRFVAIFISQNLAQKTRKQTIVITEKSFLSVIAINLFLIFSARNQFLSPLRGSPGAFSFQGFASLTPGYCLAAPPGLVLKRRWDRLPAPWVAMVLRRPGGHKDYSQG
jgi:hypothetical protein